MNEKINDIILALSFAEDIRPEYSLKNDLGFDSLRLTELLVALEDGFDIQFDESDIDFKYFQTVNDTYILVEKYI